MSIKRITTGHYFNIAFCYVASVQGKSGYQILQWDSPRFACESRRFPGPNCFCELNVFSIEIFKISNLGRLQSIFIFGSSLVSPSSETQGQSVGPREKARRKFFSSRELKNFRRTFSPVSEDIVSLAAVFWTSGNALRDIQKTAARETRSSPVQMTTPENTITYHNTLCLSPQNFA